MYQQSVLSIMSKMVDHLQCNLYMIWHEEIFLSSLILKVYGCLLPICPQTITYNKDKFYDSGMKNVFLGLQVDPDTLQVRYNNDNKLTFKEIGRSYLDLHLCLGGTRTTY